MYVCGPPLAARVDLSVCVATPYLLRQFKTHPSLCNASILNHCCQCLVQVRVFQFTERPRTAPVVHFESVGAPDANAATRVSEPPGFQLLLQSLVHSADVTTSAYSPSFKHVAVADAAGMVSLVDLSKPAVLWLQVRTAEWTEAAADGCATGAAAVPGESNYDQGRKHCLRGQGKPKRADLHSVCFLHVPSNSQVKFLRSAVPIPSKFVLHPCQGPHEGARRVPLARALPAATTPGAQRPHRAP
jgi:hypothetical protein